MRDGRVPTCRASVRRVSAGAALALAALGAMSGCYERTIRSTGFGPGQPAVQKPYQESNPVDDLLFGPLDKDRARPAPADPARPHTAPKP